VRQGSAFSYRIHTHCSYSDASTPMSPGQPHTQAVPELSCSNAGDAAPPGSTVQYQMRQRSFTSSSGSGYTTWYFVKSDKSVLLPPMIPQAMTGHLYIHLDSSTNVYQYWMLGANNHWESVSKGVQNPLNHDRVLAIRSNGEPSWVTRATTNTTQSRKERDLREKSVRPSL